MSWLWRALAGALVSLTVYAQTALAAASPNTNPAGQQIVISLSRQMLVLTDSGGSVVLQTPITSGGPFTPTPLGVYSVLAKRTDWIMQSPWPIGDWRYYPDSHINYSLLFQWSGYFMHDAA